MVDGLLSLFGALIAPRRCAFCIGVAPDRPFCDGCRDSLPWNRSACPVCALPQKTGVAHVCASCATNAPQYDLAWSAFRYEAPIDQAIHGLKYHAQFRHARLLGAAMADALAQRALPLPDLLLPMPLHPHRLRQRGYNQALELARGITRLLKIDIDVGSARRTRATADQIGQRAAARRRNVKGVFAADASLQGIHLAIVDDVMTTGSTVDELARACRAAGAARIEVWTAARAV